MISKIGRACVRPSLSLRVYTCPHTYTYSIQPPRPPKPTPNTGPHLSTAMTTTTAAAAISISPLRLLAPLLSLAPDDGGPCDCLVCVVGVSDGLCAHPHLLSNSPNPKRRRRGGTSVLWAKSWRPSIEAPEHPRRFHQFDRFQPVPAASESARRRCGGHHKLASIKTWLLVQAFGMMPLHAHLL